ncbi:hypothetical protein I310_04961 [Cryptococcus deuterogattii CA1014]|nr:hypothetical protein I310_04961 [Cryptococcus deuterogattii CA1014]
MNTNPENDEEADRREGWWEEEQARLIAESKRPPIDPTKANIFDGQYLHKAKADYQLCDITDPFIMRYIDDTSHLSTICTLKSGWYTFPWISLIKGLVRAKYMYMLETGLPAPDAICQSVLEEYGKGKMNGPPEDPGGRRGGAGAGRGNSRMMEEEEQEDSVDSGEAEAEGEGEGEGEEDGVVAEDNEDEGDRDEEGLDHQDKGDDDL